MFEMSNLYGSLQNFLMCSMNMRLVTDWVFKRFNCYYHCD